MLHSFISMDFQIYTTHFHIVPSSGNAQLKICVFPCKQGRGQQCREMTSVVNWHYITTELKVPEFFFKLSWKHRFWSQVKKTKTRTKNVYIYKTWVSCSTKETETDLLHQTPAIFLMETNNHLEYLTMFVTLGVQNRMFQLCWYSS